jgi:hypothetical protein
VESHISRKTNEIWGTRTLVAAGDLSTRQFSVRLETKHTSGALFGIVPFRFFKV